MAEWVVGCDNNMKNNVNVELSSIRFSINRKLLLIKK